MPISSETLTARIKSALSAAGLTQQSLAAAIGLDPTALSKALSGNRNLKSLEVALIAEQLGVSVQSLLAESEAPAVLLAARAQPDTSPALASALARTNLYLELGQLLTDVGVGWTATLGDHRNLDGQAHQQGDELARRVRAEMAIGDADLPYNLVDLAALLEEKLGVDVSFEQLPTGLDGLSVACEGLCLALISSGIPATRQRFTLAHEIGHLAAGDSQDLRVDENVYGHNTLEEKRANAFAASFLMPASALRKAMPNDSISEEVVAALLDRYGISQEALAFRLHNIGVIGAAGRDHVRSMSSNRITLRRGRVRDLQAGGGHRLPGNLVQRAFEAYGQGRISIRPLANLLSISPERLLQELNPPTTTPYGSDFMESAL